MEHYHFDIDLGYDEEHNVVRWATATDTGVPLDARKRKLLTRAIDAYFWNEARKKN